VGRELLPQAQAARTLGAAERPLGPPGTAGQVTAYDVYRAILTTQPYPVKGLLTFGTDVLMGNGEPLQGKAALEALDFYVHVDLFANPSASLADVLLPAASCWERAALRSSLGTGAETATWAQFREPVVPPQPESRSEVAIIMDLATRLGLGEHFFHGDLEAAYAHELAPSGLTVRELRQHPRGLRARGETRYQKYAEPDRTTGRPRGFPTPTRKVELYATRLARAGYAPLPVYEEPGGSPHSRPEVAQAYPLVLTFFRLVQFCDVQHRNIPRLRRQVPEPFLEIHPATAAAAGIRDGEWVTLETATGRIRLKARFKDSLHPQVVATAHGWWQGCRELGLPGYDPFGPEGANANLLVPNDVVDPISGSVPHRSQRCRVRKESIPA
jgi:anaerobic selenocysteine-containing dehydrogenase